MDSESRIRYSDLLWAGRTGDRMPVGGNRYSTFIQIGPGDHPAFCKGGTGLLPGVKRPGRGVDHPASPSSAVKERVQFFPYSPPVPSRQGIGEIYFLRN